MNGLTMRLMHSLSIVQMMVCEVCKQPIDGDMAVAVLVRMDIEMNGKDAHSQCPSCMGEVEDHRDRGYRIRYGKFVRLREAKRRFKGPIDEQGVRDETI